MNGNHAGRSVARRLFLTRLGMGVSVVGASVARRPEAQAQSAIDVRWQPARHAQDDWLDKIPGQHRFVFDSTSADGLSMALQFANNYYSANQSGYDPQDKDLAVVIVVRHKSTSFGYTDAMWAKYGKYLSDHASFVDPKTKEAPTINVHGPNGNGSGQAGRLDGLIKRGVNLAVCQMATRNIAGIIARGTGATQDAIFSEL